MKGEKTIDLNGDEIKIRFDFGAVEDFCEELDIDFSGWQEEALNKPKNIRLLTYYMAKDHNKGLKPEDLRRMQFGEIQTIMALISESTAGLTKAAGNETMATKKK